MENKKSILFEIITDSTVEPFFSIKNSLAILNSTLRKAR